MNTNTRTPGPWQVERDTESARDLQHWITGPEGGIVAGLNCSPENAAFIVTACNSHDALVAALEAIATQCGPYAENGKAQLDYATIGNIARASLAMLLQYGEP
jgi:hypothetical protein